MEDNAAGDEDAGGTNEAERQQRKPPRKQAPILRMFRALKRRIDKYYRETKEAESAHDRNERVLADWTRRLGQFTIVLALVSIGGLTISYFALRETQRSYEPLRESADEMRRANMLAYRPRITITPSEWGHYEVDGNKFWGAEGIILTNAGNMFAERVTTSGGFVPFGAFSPERQAAQCAIADREAIKAMVAKSPGTVISQNGGHIEVDLQTEGKFTDFGLPPQNDLMDLIGCVGFQRPGEAERHHVRFRYEIFAAEASGTTIWRLGSRVSTPVHGMRLMLYPGKGNDED